MIELSQAQYDARKASWEERNQIEIAAGRRPLKPEPPPIRVRKEGFFGLYIGPWCYRIIE